MGPLVSIFATIASPLTNLVGGLFNRVLGGVLGGLANLPGQILGFVRNLLGGAINVITAGFRMAFQAVGAALGAVVGGLVTAIRSSISAAAEFGKAALSLRSKTGMSYGAAGKLLTKGMAFGMSPGETAGAFGNQNPMVAQMMGTQNFGALASEQASYRAMGPMGAMMGNAMLNARFGGQAPESVQMIAGMDPGKVAKQEQWANNIGGKMGMSGSDIQTYAEDFQLAMSKVGTVLQLIQLKFAAAIGPSLVAGLEKVADFFGRNSEKISRVLEHVGKALSGVFLKGLEVALNFLDANSGKIETWFMTAFDYVIYRLPAALMMAGAFFLRAGAVIMQALSFIVAAFANGVQYLVQNGSAISDFFNNITSSFVAAIPGIANVFNSIVSIIQEFINIVSAISNGPIGQMVRSIGQGARNVGNAVGINTGDPNSGGAGNNVINGIIGGMILKTGLGMIMSRLGAGGQGGGGGGDDKCCCCDGDGGGGGLPDIPEGVASKGLDVLKSAGRGIAGMASATYSGLTGGATLAGAGASAVVGTTILGAAAGTAAGYGLYRAGQGLGLIDPTQGFGDRMANGWGRTRDIFTLNWGHYDQTVLEQQAADEKKKKAEEAAKKEAAKKEAEQKAAPLPPVQAAVAAAANAGNNMIQSGLDYVQKNGPDIANNSIALSKSLSSRGVQMNAQADNMENKANSLLSQMNQKLDGINNNTKEEVASTENQTKQLMSSMNVLAMSLTYAGQDAAYSIVE